MATEINSEIDASKFQAAADKSEILMCVTNRHRTIYARFLMRRLLLESNLKKKVHQCINIHISQDILEFSAFGRLIP